MCICVYPNPKQNGREHSHHHQCTSNFYTNQTTPLSDVQVLDRCGLLTPQTVLAHGVHLRPSELTLLKERCVKRKETRVTPRLIGGGGGHSFLHRA